MPDYQATKVTGETLATSTTAATLSIDPHADQFILYQPSVDFRLSLNPALIDAVFYDASADSGSKYKINGGGLVHDLRARNTSTGTGTLLDSSTTSDFLYLCFSDPVSGIHLLIPSPNGSGTAALAIKYRKNDDTWASLSVTDNTRATRTFATNDRSITWTAVTDWKSAILVGASGIVDNATTGEQGTRRGFWIQIAWNAALDSDTEISDIWTINQGTAYGYFRSGTEYNFTVDHSQVGAIEADLASGTDTMQITWIRSVH
jgi:hypothetical protein